MRAAIDECNGGVRVRLAAEQNVFIILFLAFWLCGWGIATMTLVENALAEGWQRSPLFLAGGLWCSAFTVLVVYSLLWQIHGREEILTNTIGISHRYRLGFWERRRHYPWSASTRMRYTSKYQGRTNNSGIVIEHDGQARLICYGLCESEARRIIEALGNLSLPEVGYTGLTSAPRPATD